MAEKTKQVKEHTRRLKNGKVVKVRQHTAKYDAAEEEAKSTSKKEGAGEEFATHKKALRSRVGSVCDTMGVSEDDFAHWFEGDGSDADKRAAEQMRNFFGEAMYNKISDAAADSYSNGISAFVSRNKDALSAFNLAGHTKSFGTTPAEFSEWYEGTGSKADKRCEKAMRERLGDAAYEEFSNYAADHYRKGNELSMASRITTSMGYGKTLDGTPVGKANPAPSKESSENPKKESPAPNAAVNRSNMKYDAIRIAQDIANSMQEGDNHIDPKNWHEPIFECSEKYKVPTSEVEALVTRTLNVNPKYIKALYYTGSSAMNGSNRNITPNLIRAFSAYSKCSESTAQDILSRMPESDFKWFWQATSDAFRSYHRKFMGTNSVYRPPKINANETMQRMVAANANGIPDNEWIADGAGMGFYPPQMAKTIAKAFETDEERQAKRDGAAFRRKYGAVEDKKLAGPWATKQVTATKNGKPISITFKGE